MTQTKNGIAAFRPPGVPRGNLSPRSLKVWAAMCFGQRGVVFPGAKTKGTPEAQITMPPAGARIVHLRASGGSVVGMFAPASRDHAPAVIYFYGNGSCLARGGEVFEPLRGCGVNVLMMEYMGYGMSGGRASEAGCYATADAGYEWLTKEMGIAGDRIVAAGASLGGAVAIDLAARRQVAGAVTLLTFSSIARMVRHHCPGMPGKLIRHRFESIEKIGRVRCPMLIIHSREDTWVPETMAEELARAAGGKARYLSVNGGEHGMKDLVKKAGDEVFAEIREFVWKVTDGKANRAG